MFNLKQVIVLFAILLVGCDYPPDGATTIQKQLEAQITRGQVYLIHASDELSFVIKNSEYNRSTVAEQDELIASVEEAAINMLAKHHDLRVVRIYFVGDGAAGINNPYLCHRVSQACQKVKQ